jgi:predicted nucleic acid-binding protein
MAWCFDDDPSGYSVSVLRRLATEDAVVPSIWLLEVVNTLLVAERAKQFDPHRSAFFVRALERLPVSVIHDRTEDVFHAIATLAREQGLSAYDAAYVWLGAQRGLALATLDGSMRGACQRVGVALLA